MTSRMSAFCRIGVGSYLLGMTLDEALLNSAVNGTRLVDAAILSAVVQGYMYASAEDKKAH